MFQEFNKNKKKSIRNFSHFAYTKTNLICFFLFSELRHMCTDSNQCDTELICGHDNQTKSTGFNRNPSSTSTPKICLCDEENGYQEDFEDNNCSGK